MHVLKLQSTLEAFLIEGEPFVKRQLGLSLQELPEAPPGTQSFQSALSRKSSDFRCLLIPPQKAYINPESVH